MAKLFYPQISLEDYQIFRKFMLPGEFPQTHDQWVAKNRKVEARGCGQVLDIRRSLRRRGRA